MNQRVMQFYIGLTVVATAIIAFILVLLFSDMSSLGQGNYTVYIRLPEAPGVGRHSPIRKSGIRIGRVTDIRFAEDDRTVLVTAAIDSNRRIYRNEVCEVVSSLVMGDTALEFVRSSDAKMPETLVKADETVDGIVAEDPARAIASLQQGLSQTMKSVNEASGDMRSVLGRVDRLLAVNEDRITKVIGQTDETLQVVRRTLDNANGILGDPQVQSQLKATVQQMPGVIEDARKTLGQFRQTVATANDTLGDLKEFTRPLGQHGDALVNRIEGSTEKLNLVMDQMLRFMQDLNNPQGSLGQLVHDPEFYQHLNHAARNIDELTRQLKPILDDARVFSDKIARHPESLGVRGALQRNQGTK